MNRPAFRAPLPGLLAITLLLPLTGILLIAQAALDSWVPLLLFVVAGFAVFVVGVATAVSAGRNGVVSGADAARLEELEPLPPTADDEGDRR
ncbi:hypothetical protein IMZ11_24600 [Microtetraspora sp. AC03309]|uniref:hypothetical protein n=1 Tax=Microtetraspora sp. AC03309 TaxID=2779376 RepID=UPI001E4AC982|nr:hypothetical protein [Microtetraspora sp. AC03309]MCC5578811.1 hypothetical protein [Microtetraspora sp. AC03309]